MIVITLLRSLRPFGLAVAALLLLPAAALAAATSSPHLVLPGPQVWTLIIGALVPLATYVINKLGPWVHEPAKAVVLLVVSAAATALYTALDTNVIGFNNATLQLILSGVVASLAAHKLLWQPSGVSTLLGARQGPPLASRAGSWSDRGDVGAGDQGAGPRPGVADHAAPEPETVVITERSAENYAPAYGLAPEVEPGASTGAPGALSAVPPPELGGER